RRRHRRLVSDWSQTCALPIWAKSGFYRAPPVRRVHISKGPGSKETRPIGIPTLEDKVLQRAIVMLLQPIYEQDFKPYSYGFRPEIGRASCRERVWMWVVGASW